MKPAEYTVKSIVVDLLAYPFMIIQKGSPLIHAIDVLFEMAYEGECFPIIQDLCQNGEQGYKKPQTLEQLYIIMHHDDRMGLSLSHNLRLRVLSNVLMYLSLEVNQPGRANIVNHFNTASEIESKIKTTKYFGLPQYVFEDTCEFLQKQSGTRRLMVLDFLLRRATDVELGAELTAIYKYLLHTGRVAARQTEQKTSSSTLPGIKLDPDLHQNNKF